MHLQSVDIISYRNEIFFGVESGHVMFYTGDIENKFNVLFHFTGNGGDYTSNQNCLKINF